MGTNLSNPATFWPVKMKLNGLLAIAVMVLAGCDQNVDYIGLELGQSPGAETDRRIKAMGKPPAPDPRAKRMWGTDLRAAIVRARKNNKRILLAFFDSSWDHAGVQWNFIYTQPRFLDFAQKELELVKVDGSANPRADAEAQKLKEIFDVAVLAYFVLDPEGRIVWPKNEGSFGPQPDFYNLDGVNRTSAAGTVPQSVFCLEREKEFIKRLKLILKGTEPIQGKANIKTAGVPSSTLPSSALLAGQYRSPSKLTKAELYKATELFFFDTDLQNADLKDLAKYHQLKSLKIARSPQVTDIGLKELAAIKQIKELSLGGSWITDSTLKELANLKQIVRLDLVDCPKVTAEGVDELQKALPGCRLFTRNPGFGRKMEILKPTKEAPLTAKETAEMIETAIGRQLSKPSSELTETDWQKVTELKFTFTKISDASLKEVAKLDQLKMLWLDNNQITDEGLKEVAKLQQLTHLGLAGTYVTDAGIKDLAKLKNLSLIRLGRTNVTIDGVATLKRALSECDIYYFR